MKLLLAVFGAFSHHATAATAVVVGATGAVVYRYDDPLLYVFAAIGVAAAHYWMPVVQWSLAVINALFGIALATSLANYVAGFLPGSPPSPAVALLIAAGWMWIFKKLLPVFDAILVAFTGVVTGRIKAWFDKRGGGND